MKTFTLYEQDGAWRQRLTLEGNARYRRTYLRLDRPAYFIWRRLDPEEVRALRKALGRREAELVAAGYLEAEEL